MNRFDRRIHVLRERLKERETVFVNDTADVFYLTGFTGDSSYLVIDQKKTFFITDGRYVEQIKIESAVELEIIEIVPNRDLYVCLSDILTQIKPVKLYLDTSAIFASMYERIAGICMSMSLAVGENGWIKQQRMVKDELEIEILRENLIVTEIGYHYVIRMVEEGMSETEIAAELEYYLRKKGAVRMAFYTIIASGSRAALPHGAATEKKVQKGEVILFDFGIFKSGYCSDFTRCYSFDKMYDLKIEEIRRIVYEALRAAESVIKPGVPAKDVHEAAMAVIRDAGYEKYFNHSTGHGVGIDIHAQPRISAASDTTLREGMVFTVEPGIYLPGIGGIRLEDMVVVRKDGVEVLTKSDYEI